ncbi:MAG: sugar transferase [Brevundimonas sp.]
MVDLSALHDDRPMTRPPNPELSEISWMLLAPAAVLSFLILPHVYGGLVFGPGYVAAFKGPVLSFMVLNACANMLVVATSLRLKERLDRKLAMVLTRIVLIHGALAFFILLAHQFHSNQVMLLSVSASLALGPIFMFIEHRRRAPKVAVLDTGREPLGEREARFDYITNPSQDLRRYDVVLTPEMGALPNEWAIAITRATLSGTPVRHLAEFTEEANGIVSIDHFDVDHLPLGGLTSYRTRKRLADIGIVLMTAPATIPLLLVGALLVRVTMGGPVMFIQERTGLGGEPFRMYKLRTMRPARDGDNVKTTSTNDPRITRVGYWLRRFRIDELPQLLNVLQGDMSIIGPRPEWTVLAQRYARDLPVYAYRHLVRPGITGWAQVRGGYAGDLAETRTKVGYDLFYIKNLSFSLDVQIILRTVWTLLSGSGAR